MDSSSLGSLVTCLKRVRERDGRLVLVGVGGTPMKVLTLTGLDRVFDIVGSTAELPAS
jgi:anti-anti-sigma factor